MIRISLSQTGFNVIMLFSVQSKQKNMPKLDHLVNLFVADSSSFL